MITAFGPELDDVVGGSDDVGVVLDDDDGVAAVEEGAEGGVSRCRRSGGR